jgi:N-acetylglutamate synthase-like GNAT family acetyltransferase
MQVRAKDEEIWIAEINQIPVGFAALQWSILELGGIYVHPDCARQGITTVLLVKIESILEGARLLLFKRIVIADSSSILFGTGLSNSFTNHRI